MNKLTNQRNDFTNSPLFPYELFQESFSSQLLSFSDDYVFSICVIVSRINAKLRGIEKESLDDVTGLNRPKRSELSRAIGKAESKNNASCGFRSSNCFLLQISAEKRCHDP
jgi:hypothetical protein